MPKMPPLVARLHLAKSNWFSQIFTHPCTSHMAVLFHRTARDRW